MRIVRICLLGIVFASLLCSCRIEDVNVNKEQVATGTAGVLLAKEGLELIEDNAPKFEEYLQIADKEVCTFIDEEGTTLACHLFACEEEPCRRELQAQDVDRNKIAFISIDALQELFSSIEVFCLKNEKNCEIIASNYDHIDKVFLLKED